MTRFVDFPERLLWFRSKAEMTQRELAAKSGVSLPQITRYEKGTSAPRLQAVMKLADALGVSVDDFTKSREDQGLRKLVLTHEEDGTKTSIIIPDDLIERIQKGADLHHISFEQAFNNMLVNSLQDENFLKRIPRSAEGAAPKEPKRRLNPHGHRSREKKNS